MDNDMVILLADPDMSYVQLTHNTLKAKGLTNEIIHFGSGNEILDFLFRRGEGCRRIDHKSYLLVMDIQMPVVDGLEVLRQVKESPVLKEMPVIILTSTDDQCVIDRCHALGCNLYITKPMDFERFTEIIREFGGFLRMVLQI